MCINVSTVYSFANNGMSVMVRICIPQRRVGKQLSCILHTYVKNVLRNDVKQKRHPHFWRTFGNIRTRQLPSWYTKFPILLLATLTLTPELWSTRNSVAFNRSTMHNVIWRANLTQRRENIVKLERRNSI